MLFTILTGNMYQNMSWVFIYFFLNIALVKFLCGFLESLNDNLGLWTSMFLEDFNLDQQIFAHLNLGLSVEKKSWELLNSKFFTQRAVFKDMGKSYGISEMSCQSLEKRSDFLFVREVDNLGSFRKLFLKLLPITALLQVQAVKLHQRA